MSFNHQFTLYSPLDMGVPNNFDSAAPTDTPDGDVAGALGYAQPGSLSDGMWYPPQHQLPWRDWDAGHTDLTSYGSWDVASPHPQFDNRLPRSYPVPHSQWFDQGSTGVSPSYGNTLFPMNLTQWSALSPYEHPNDILPIQHSAHNTSEPSHLPALGEGNHYDAGTINYTTNLYPDLPLDKGSISGMNSAVAGADDSVASASPVHSHRRRWKKGSTKEEVGKDLVHDCAYEGGEEPFERDRRGYAAPSGIYQRLRNLKTEALDRLLLPDTDAHGADSEGNYICCARASIVNGRWQMNKGACDERLQDKDCYRRHFEEQHLALRRMIKGKYVPIETRIRQALEEIKDFERQKAEAETRPTKKRKRASDEECSGSPSFQRDDENQNKRRCKTLHPAHR